MRAIMHYYSTVTNKVSNVVIFTNHIFFAYALHKEDLLRGNKQNY